MVGRVLKIKTGFRGFENEQKIRDFKSLQRYDKKFYASVLELHSQEEICIREIFSSLYSSFTMNMK